MTDRTISIVRAELGLGLENRRLNSVLKVLSEVLSLGMPYDGL